MDDRLVSVKPNEVESNDLKLARALIELHQNHYTKCTTTHVFPDSCPVFKAWLALRV